MLRHTMIILATAAALTGALSTDAFARGGGGHGGGGAHMGGGFGGAHMGGRFGGGFAGHHFAGTAGHFGHFHHERRFDHHRRFGGGWDYSFGNYGCSYGYPYYNPYSCDLYAY
jgi:hypothetical protein